MFNFYKSVIGSDFGVGGIARFSDIPPSKETPQLAEADKNLIMHTELRILGGMFLWERMHRNKRVF